MKKEGLVDPVRMLTLLLLFKQENMLLKRSQHLLKKIASLIR